MIDLSRYVNYASINGDDAPHEVVQKLQRAIDASPPSDVPLLPEPRAWMTSEWQVSSRPGGGYDIPLYSRDNSPRHD